MTFEFSIGFPSLSKLAGSARDIYTTIVAFHKNRQSLAWPSTMGRVVNSCIQNRDNGTYKPAIHYRYQVNGQDLEGTIWRFGDISYNKRITAQRVIAQYPEGRPVAVYFNPNDARDAVLERGVSWKPLANVLAVAVFAVLAYLLFTGELQRRIENLYGFQWARLLFVVVGLASTARAFYYFYKAQLACSWPTAMGKVLSSDVHTDNSGESVAYRPEVCYEYWANGVRRLGDVWRVGAGSHSSRRRAEKVVEQYPAGRELMVYFNPANPADAVLEPGKADWVSLLFGVGFTVIGFLARHSS